jgi:outer membrane protein OmpA-like peptidoglycan-associated protein
MYFYFVVKHLQILYLAILSAVVLVPFSAGRAFASNPSSSGPYEIMVVDYYTIATKAEIDDFKTLVESYLSTYIGRCADIENNAVILKKSKKATLQDINEIVKGALTFYDYSQLRDFKGFSPMIEDKLGAIDKIDFKKSKIAQNTASQAEVRSIQEYYLQKELEDLKLLINIELGMFSGNNLMVKTSTEQSLVDEKTKRQLIEQYTGTDRNSPLEPIKVKISDESFAMINFKDTSTLDQKPSASTIDQDLMSRVLDLLEQNNRKLDQMQGQMDQMRVEQIQLWQKQQDEKNIALQKQIDDLKQLVNSGQLPNPSVSSASGGRGEILNFPKQVVLYYATGSSELDASSKLALNEIIDLLARQPNVTALIAGHADKSGDTQKNALIANKRALGVKDFFIRSGLSSERFITVSYGDKNDNGIGNQRRVVIEFILRTP